MLDPLSIYQTLRQFGVDFFTGVPDSLLKEFCACILDQTSKNEHLIAANEGGAIALASGHYLATEKCALVYLQNSGLGNTVNPLLSLTDAGVYSIPMLLMVGWRGEPGLKDEPQHVRQGAVMLPMLESMGLTAYRLSSDQDTTMKIIKEAHQDALKNSRPVVLVASKGLFQSYQRINSERELVRTNFLREQALELIVDWADDRSVIVATTGKTSRELFELRKLKKKAHQQDFLTVGSMGHCSQIALGVAIAQPDRDVICVDGDGAVLMHMGSLALIGQSTAERFVHIIINNGAHESVGAQPTVALDIDFAMLGKSLGYRSVQSCESVEALKTILVDLEIKRGPVMIEVRVATGARDDLGRPTSSPKENKEAFMKHLREM